MQSAPAKLQSEALKHSLPTQSTYSKRVRIHRTGVFRVHTLAGPDHADGFSAPKRIRVP